MSILSILYALRYLENKLYNKLYTSKSYTVCCGFATLS